MSDDTPQIGVEDALAQLDQLVSRNRFDAARTVLEQALTSYPDHPDILYYAALVAFAQDDEQQARGTVQRILELEPQHYAARFLLVMIYKHLDQYVEAEQLVIDMLREYPEDVELYALYAEIMLATNNFDKAQRLADEALRRDPENESALNSSVLAAMVNSPGEQARQQLADLVREYPDQMVTSLRVIQVLIDEGRLAQAYELATELVQIDPSNQDVVDMAQELKVASHWSMKPMWPMRKWGWGGSIAIWLMVVLLLRSPILESVGLQDYAGVISLVFIAYVIYSWVWPWLLSRIMERT